jgi:DNA-binding CsgD family transcriptional regulator
VAGCVWYSRIWDRDWSWHVADTFGRERQLAVLGRLFEQDRYGPRAVVVRGEPGIGKTTLWEAALGRAGERCAWVGRSRPSGAEAQLSYVALGDLFEGVGAAEFGVLPVPQRRALEVALLRAEVAGDSLEPRTVASGVLGVLRGLARRGTALVAIDDAQWLDRSSAAALAFAARRVEANVRFLLTLRSGAESPLVDALKPMTVDIEVGPLGYFDVRRMVAERLGPALPGRLLRRICEVAGGNPLFALELGHALADTGWTGAAGDPLPLPEQVEAVLGVRVSGLPKSVRRALLAVALSGNLRTSQLETVVGARGIEDAVDAGVLVVDGERVRPSHPLVATAAARRSRPSERRQMHAQLAHAVSDDELRARHLALGTPGVDDDLAETVAVAARSAAARGGAEGAVDLAEQALRLTPEDSPQRGERVLALAEYVLVCEPQRLSALLSAELNHLPPGRLRARAHLLLADGNDVATAWDYDAELDRALAECGNDSELRAIVTARKVLSTALVHIAGIAAAEARAVDALPDARVGGGDAERLVLHAVGWTRILRGRGVTDLSEQADASPDAAWPLFLSFDLLTAIRSIWRGEATAARTMLTRLMAVADERGEAMSSMTLSLHLCELSLRSGQWRDADRFLGGWEQSTDYEIFPKPVYARCCALLAAGRGLTDEAERWATDAIAYSEAVALRWDGLEAMRARGLAALAAGKPAEAATSLGAVWAHTQREGVGDPGAFPVAPDLVEALVECGRGDEATDVTERLEQLADELDHPWARVGTVRCKALLLGDDPTSAGAIDRLLTHAADAYGDLGLHFDRARSFLILGRKQRRLRKWAAARLALEQAATTFSEIGSQGWQALARAEIDRVGARRPQPAGHLTPSEQRVARLAADGHANKEIAQILVISVHTVEAHLSRAYAKLGVRSRGQLARRLAAEA